jgi:diguanylate cyclase (GGDEF)-like protein
MIARIKNFIFTVLGLLMLLRFLLLICDPQYASHPIATASGGQSLYTSGRSIIDGIYWLTGYVQLPVQLLYSALVTLVPAVQNDWFPVLDGPVVGALLKKLVQAVPSFPWPDIVKTKPPSDWMPGYFDWLSLVTMFFLSLLSPLLEKLGELIKNAFWTLFIELSFTQKKQAQYQEALRQRAEALMKMNNEYRNLSKEASQLKQTIVTDELTKVYNKRFFIERIKEEFNRARNEHRMLSLIMLDIDHFKKINDTYGHLAGDEVLRDVAQVAKLSTPDKCYCCRFGGEEFTIILPGKTHEESMAVAQKILEGVPMLNFASIPGFHCTVSLGVNTVNFSIPESQAVDTFDEFIKRADDELYRAKLGGRNQICDTKTI